MALLTDRIRSTINGMASKKKPADRSADRHKPGRMVRVPERFAVLLEEIAADQENTLTEQVKIACYQYLIRLGKLPRPSTAD